MEDNKLIAEFMGNPTIFNTIHDATLYQVKEQGNMAYHVDELQYHTSWDWLMPVVHKCYQEHTCSQERMNSNDAYEIKTCDITRVYKAVVKFIKGQEVMDIHAQYSFYIECCVDEAEGEIALSFEEWKQLNN